MPELAEVEYYRKQWNSGVGSKVLRVHLHREKRVFRGTDVLQLSKSLLGKKLDSSETHGKQMLFRFSGKVWLGIHLGMTGRLSTAPAKYEPGKHDHLVLFQKERALVFNDMRLFGRVLFAEGDETPAWWSSVPDPRTKEFTLQHVETFLARHKRLPVKAAILLQKGFPGIGNWMADEILWRARVAPGRLSAELRQAERKAVWKETRFVSREAIDRIGTDFGDPPKGWLFHQRWGRKGVCPKHKTPLLRETIGGRTTAWCADCQI